MFFYRDKKVAQMGNNDEDEIDENYGGRSFKNRFLGSEYMLFAAIVEGVVNTANDQAI